MEKIVNYLEDYQWLKTPEHMSYFYYHLMKAKRILEWMGQDVSKEEKLWLQKNIFTFFQNMISGLI